MLDRLPLLSNLIVLLFMSRIIYVIHSFFLNLFSFHPIPPSPHVPPRPSPNVMIDPSRLSQRECLSTLKSFLNSYVFLIDSSNDPFIIKSVSFIGLVSRITMSNSWNRKVDHFSPQHVPRPNIANWMKKKKKLSEIENFVKFQVSFWLSFRVSRGYISDGGGCLSKGV